MEINELLARRNHLLTFVLHFTRDTSDGESAGCYAISVFNGAMLDEFEIPHSLQDRAKNKARTAKLVKGASPRDEPARVL